VVIIYYQEALSTLLRNVLSVLNLTPPQLLGEIVMVNDNSSLPQLRLLESYLDRLPRAARAKIRLFHRDVHNGIVGARIRGAQEARFPVLVFLDSHSTFLFLLVLVEANFKAFFPPFGGRRVHAGVARAVAGAHP
jgi:polypeptide N-acetylgalactosaminyltransferase